ncbi:hypothetical protein BWI93_02955 [Siphonobacter sp. BAB-5385]|uniref:MmcQ/YjbR family DNA-binding protein n=1 Tax=unclassified Siphonobacter TaxID=2635712 RepID=UPI000B9DEC9E|nr:MULTISPECIES: MmcQ/YjbR family DNA-binding protein [unclassified Siphonobacter]OZI09649.1 hypothetical protein BWI93_02955 [Siphonobacter sp. BAB-5385]PMD96947.1 hypothetical protein BWI97_09690 [Siphonobacter sp. BAB-5405]
MAVRYDTVRSLALEYPHVTEGLAYGTPSLHLGRKLLGRLQEDGQTLAIKLNPEERETYLEQAPDTFFLTDHYRNHPVILVDLTLVRLEDVELLLEKAWRFLASARQVKAYGQRVGKQ